MKRPIAWADLRLDALDDERRTRLGRTWASRMEQEHLAVGAFALLLRELAEDGCDPTVLGLVARACADEIEHAETCRGFAAAAIGPEAVSRLLRGVPSPPRLEDVSPSLRTLLHVVEMCCLSETFTAAYLTEMRRRTSDPVARAAVDSLLAEEIDHSRAGWAYLAWRRSDPTLAELAAHVPELLRRTYDPVIRDAAEHPEPDDPELESFAYLGRNAAAQIYRETLAEVILPGFRELGIELADAPASFP